MKPKQFFFVMLAALAMVTAGGGAGFYFAIGSTHRQADQLADDLAAVQTAQQQLDTLGKLRTQYHNEIVPIMPLIDDALPRNKQQSEILAQIERVAGATGVTQPFQSVTMPAPTGLPSIVSQTIKAGDVLALPINFTAMGTPQQLQAFTTQLETLNRYTDVTSLAFDHTDKTKPDAYVFTLNAYIKP